MKTALVMIVRDEARCIVRCLRSVRDRVDEMIVLDTGSRDATPRLAAAAGARVRHFRWCDDFAAARNAALEHSRADWNLVLDADEVLAGGGDWLAGLRDTPATFVGRVGIDNAFDDGGGVHISRSRLPRLLPRGVRYVGRIHEQPQSALPRHDVPLRIAHDGYRDAAMRAKRERNLALLQRALAETPDDAYLWYQLGKEHSVRGEHEHACEPLARAAAATPGNAPWRHDLVVRLLFALKRCARHDEAMRLAADELGAWPESPDFHFALGDLLLDWAAHAPQRAHELLPMAEAAWQRCLAIGERTDLDGAVAGRGSMLAAHNLAVLRAQMARPEVAHALRGLSP